VHGSAAWLAGAMRTRLAALIAATESRRAGRDARVEWSRASM
jgi:hypothetical protein